MVTTIQISKDLKKELQRRKIHKNDTYEEVIWDLVEDTMELSEETKKAIKRAEEDLKAGKVKTLEQIEKELNI